MKKIILLALLFCAMLSLSYAQTSTSKTDAKTEKDAKKSTGKNKDGSPDMRLKVNKDAAKANAEKAKTVVTPPAPPAPKPTPPVVAPAPVKPAPVKPAPVVTPPTPKPVTPVVKPVAPTTNPNTSDKVIGTDDKGRTIYEGKRGGHYYINKNGNKEYVKKS